MDVILDCYFDNVFCTLERSSLMVRYKRRQLVDYLNTVIQGCVRGEDCDEDTGVSRAVMAAIRYHTSTRNANGTVCLMGKYHNILYIAAKLCYDWKLNDTPTVALLLNDIYQCERTFERLFIGAIFGTSITHLISGWKSDFANSEENLAAMDYFLKHATKGKLEYVNTVDGLKTRFVDIPTECYGRAPLIKLAVQFYRDEVLLLLLRYGAKVLLGYYNDEVPIENPLRQLNMFCGSNLPLNHISGPLESLKVLLRAVPTIGTPASNSLDDNVGVLIDTKNELGLIRLYFHPRLLQEGVIPPSRCGFAPPELKHLSRCAIRNALRENWQLPSGIRSLEIPTSLQDYLDLLED